MASNSISYPLSRGYAASARLNLQHFLHARDLGYIVHPKIPIDSPRLKVADVGTGTGIWLVDLSSQVPQSAELDGFDVSRTPYPPQEWLPPNVTLDILDIFGDIPDHLLGKYDVVHMRYMSILVRDNDPSAIIRNALKLLRPGGYFQWSEQNYPVQHVITANESVSAEPFVEVKTELEVQTKSTPRRFDWMADLEQSLSKQGLQDIIVDKHPEQPQFYSPWQQTYMMVAEEMSYSSPDGATVRNLLNKTQAQAPEGVFWFRGHLTFVGQKPLDN